MTERLPTVELEPSAFPSLFRDHLGFLTSRISQRLNAQVERVTLPHGLSAGQYGLLLLLQTDGPQAQIVLSQRVGLDRTTVMRTVDLLEGRSLVRRDPDEADRRKNSVALTVAGAALLAQTLPGVRQAEREVTDVLSEHEQAQLTSLLHRLLGF